jgi:hypothetical protein
MAAIKREDAAIIEAASKRRERLKKERYYANFTTANGRYAKSIAQVAKLVEGKRSLVVHLVGVGSIGGPQVREVIRALQAGRSRPIEMHVMDYDKRYLKAALNAVEREGFEGVTLIPYFLGEEGGKPLPKFDMAAPTALPKNRAHLVVCTNVLMHLNKASAHVGLYHLSTMLRKGGVLLVGLSDMKRLKVPQYRFGLKREGGMIPEEKLRSVGVIFRRAGRREPFHKIWESVPDKDAWGRLRKMRVDEMEQLQLEGADGT